MCGTCLSGRNLDFYPGVLNRAPTGPHRDRSLGAWTDPAALRRNLARIQRQARDFESVGPALDHLQHLL